VVLILPDKSAAAKKECSQSCILKGRVYEKVLFAIK
jgi:hypothetical protein